MQVLRVGRSLLEDPSMTSTLPNTLITKVTGEPFVDAREAAFTMNLPMYYLTNARQRTKMRIPHYRIGRMVRFKLSELAEWQRLNGTTTTDGALVGSEVSDE
jgi:hypothetical protein